MENKHHILVFKTNLHHPNDISRVEPVLNQMEGISRWTVDREDIDRVLRIETGIQEARAIIERVNSAGYLCEELDS